MASLGETRRGCSWTTIRTIGSRRVGALSFLNQRQLCGACCRCCCRTVQAIVRRTPVVRDAWPYRTVRAEDWATRRLLANEPRTPTRPAREPHEREAIPKSWISPTPRRRTRVSGPGSGGPIILASVVRRFHPRIADAWSYSCSGLWLWAIDIKEKERWLNHDRCDYDKGLHPFDFLSLVKFGKQQLFRLFPHAAVMRQKVKTPTCLV